MTPQFAVCPKETVSMLTRDRVRLDADIYRPEGPGDFPVLLMRQPYGREIASTVVYAHPIWYAAHGFIVVIQDVRGRGTSEGEFRLFIHEAEDGYDAVEWAAQLPRSTGQVGMYGFSYQGMTQLFAAQEKPPSLKAIAPAMVGYHPYTDWAYENGALLLQAGLGWAIQLAAETARLQGDQAAFQALFQASRQLPLNDENPACPEVLAHYAPDSFFHDWVNHPQPDDYWQAITPQLEGVDLPMLHVGGWFDPYLRGDIRLYQEMTARSQFPQWLWIGPWGHIPWGRKVGDRDFGPQANSPIDRLQIEWFMASLKQNPAEILNQPPVNLFAMGSNRWQALPHWPRSKRQRWKLSSQGLAAMHLEDGQLIASDGLLTPSNEVLTETSVDVVVHDPWRPVPSLGGHAAIPSGPFDRSAVDCRSDVLTYTTSPLTAPLSVAGHIEVTLQCCCDRPSFDISLTLSEGFPDGRFYALTQGYGRFITQADPWAIYQILLQPTCFSLPVGQTLRLSISAACYPAYALNPGTGQPDRTSQRINAEITTVLLQTGHTAATAIALPITQER